MPDEIAEITQNYKSIVTVWEPREEPRKIFGRLSTSCLTNLTKLIVER